MRIVVTGALGHIGSRLVRALPGRFPGIEIVMLDNLSTQRYPSLFDLPAASRYRFVEVDVADADLAPYLDGTQGCIHLAAMTDAASSFERRTELERNNFETTRRVVEACLDCGTPVIFPSSTSVYGTQKDEVDEDCTIDELKPQSPYAETKLREEALIADLAGRGLKAAILRLGTIFGPSPGMRFHTAVNKFCWQAVMGAPLTVWKTAYDQRRPYLDLSDAVAAMAFFLKRGHFDGRIYNVVTLNATVRDIVEAVGAAAGRVEVSFVEERIMNQLSYDVRANRIGDLGFCFNGDLERGIADTIRLLRQASSL